MPQIPPNRTTPGAGYDTLVGMPRTSGDHARPSQPTTARDVAGIHVLLDLFGATHLDDPGLAETALRKAAEAAGATVLSSHIHEFASTGGVSGVVVLAESHISIHTWPEHDYAALDVFLCGDADPRHAITVLSDAFGPDRIELSEHHRGKGVVAG